MANTPGLLAEPPAIPPPSRDISPIRILIFLVALIFAAEMVAMLVIGLLDLPSYLVESLLDGLIMIVLIMPALYFLQLRPLLNQIEERYQAEEALYDNEALLRKVLELLPVGVWILDHNGKMLHGNPASQSIWKGGRYVGVEGYSEYKAWWADSNQTLEPEDWAAYRALSHGKAVLNQELEIESFDGTHRYMLNSAVPILDEHQVVTGVIVVNQDITQRRMEEKARLHMNELLERFFQGIDTLIAYMDRDFNFIRVNETYARSGGHPAEFYIGKNHFDLYPHEENLEIFRRVVETGEPYSVFEKPFEYAEYPERGVTYWDWSLQPVKRTDGSVEGVVLSLVDVTERKRFELQLERQNEELRALSTAEHRQRELAEGLVQATIPLNSSLELDLVLASILEQVRRTVPFQGADIVLIEGNTLRVAGSLGFEGYPANLLSKDQPHPLEDHPFIHQVCKSLIPLKVDTGLRVREWEVNSSLEWVRSYAAVPLVVSDEVTGIINLYSNLSGAFSEEAIQHLLAFSAPAALALHNARLYQAETAARQAAETLSAAALALTQKLDLDHVINALLDHIQVIVHSDIAGVTLLQDETHMSIREVRGYGKWADCKEILSLQHAAITDSLIRTIQTDRKSVQIPSTIPQPDGGDSTNDRSSCNWLVVPIVASEQVIGLVELCHVGTRGLQQEHVYWAEALAGQAAMAIQNAWLFEQVRSSSQRLQTLTYKLVEVQENERYHIARELHDEAGQVLASLKLNLGRLEQDPACTPPIRERLAGLKGVADMVLEELHRLAMDLRPIALDRLGLVPALEQYAANLCSEGLSVQFKAVGFDGERLPQDIETSLYRIVQEALTNIVRHAQASSIGILLERDMGRVKVFVEDDGTGFETDVAERRGRLGLIGMRERAEMFGGTLIVESSPGRGTSVIVEVPDAN